jgi:hypothetical protein
VQRLFNVDCNKRLILNDEDQPSGKTTCGHRKYPGIPLLVSRAVVSSPRDPLIDIR